MNGKPPKTIRTALAAVKMFLLENDIEIPQKFWIKLRRRMKGTRAQTQETIPTNHQLKEILQHGETKARALFLLLSSSGMRIQEALHLTTNDINMSTTPAIINIRGETTKTGNRRTTFMSQEAKEALKAWLKERDQYLNNAITKSKFKTKKPTKDTRLFPFAYDNARVMWKRLLERAGYYETDPTTRITKMRIHTLRKYFRTRMSTAGIPEGIIEALLGHEEYITHIYRQFTDQDLAKFYQKGEEKLIVFETPMDSTALEKTMKDLKEENKHLQKDITRIQNYLEEVLSIDSRIYSGSDFHKYKKDGTRVDFLFDKNKRLFIPVSNKRQAELNKYWEVEIQEERENSKISEETTKNFLEKINKKSVFDLTKKESENLSDLIHENTMKYCREKRK